MKSVISFFVIVEFIAIIDSWKIIRDKRERRREKRRKRREAKKEARNRRKHEPNRTKDSRESSGSSSYIMAEKSSNERSGH